MKNYVNYFITLSFLFTVTYIANTCFKKIFLLQIKKKKKVI